MSQPDWGHTKKVAAIVATLCIIGSRSFSFREFLVMDFFIKIFNYLKICNFYRGKFSLLKKSKFFFGPLKMR